MSATKPIVLQSFKLNVTVLNLIGLYPSGNHSILYKIYGVILYLAALMPTMVLGSLHFVFTEDFAAIDFSDFVMVGLMSYTFKLMPFLTNVSKIQKCINYFDTLNYKIRGKDAKFVEDCVGSCRRNTNIFFIGCSVSWIGFVTQVFLREDPEQMPLKVWFPVSSYDKPVLYYFIYCLLIFGAGYSVFACGTIDPLIGGLAYHATAQLQILKRNLQYLDEYIADESKQSCGVIYKELIKCIRRYQEIATFVDLFKDSFSQVVFSQFVGSVFLIGLCGLQIIRMIEIDLNLVISVNYLWVVFFQIFFYCYYGTMLIEENYTLNTAIYMSNWYEYNLKEKKALLMIMERSKKPMIVTAGRILDLSLDTFTMILKRSYSLLCCFK